MAMASAANVALSTAPSSSDRASHGLNCATGTSKFLSLSKLSLIPATGLRVGSLSLHPAARTFSSARTGSYRRLKYTSAVAVSLPVLTFEGGPSGAEVELDLKCARPETARAVVHRGLITEQQNKRRGTASTLTRGEVRGGGKKPYKQKKTGRARRGSQRTPLRPGGGVIFGPKPKDWTIKINRKEKRLAISTALQYATGSFIVVEDFEDSIEPKTKAFIAAMKNWGADCSRPSLLFTTNFSENLRKSSSNVSTVKLMTPRNLNLYDILKAKKLVFTKSGIEYLNSRYGAEEEDDDEWTDEEEAEAVEEENSS